MLTLLLIVLICGVIAYAINAFPIPEPFKTVAFCVLAIFLLVVLFRQLGTSIPGLN
jgi:hypothetical protein